MRHLTGPTNAFKKRWSHARLIGLYFMERSRVTRRGRDKRNDPALPAKRDQAAHHIGASRMEASGIHGKRCLGLVLGLKALHEGQNR